MRRITFGIFIFTFSILVHAENGVTDSEILLGESTALTTGAATRVKYQNEAIDLVYSQVNASGGINGRKIRLIRYDDQFVPKKAFENVQKLANEDKVFALTEIFGTASMIAVEKIAKAQNIPLFFPITGAEIFRQPVNPNIFNIRAGHQSETDIMTDYFVNTKGFKDIGLFFQDDPLGDGGKAALHKSLQKYGLTRKVDAGFKRNSTDFIPAIKQLMKANPSVVVVWSPDVSALQFVKACVKENFKPIFVLGYSAYAPESSTEIAKLGVELYASLTIPYDPKSNIKLVQQYIKETLALGQKPSIVGFEGYLNAKFLVEALRRTGKDLTRENLKKSIETSGEFNIGDVKLYFSASAHQGLNKAYLFRVEKDGALTAIK